MARAYSKDPVVDKSLRHALRDAAAYSAMTGSGETYFSAFAVFLHATTTQIGMLAALPPLLGSLAQLVSAWWGRRIGRRKPIIVIGASVQALSLVPLALLPLWFPENGIALLILCVVVYYAGNNLTTPQWASMMGDLVPPRRRGRYFARRTRLGSVAAFCALVCAGTLLHTFASSGYTMWGYLTIFAIAIAARVVSIYQLARMYDPPGQTAVLEVLLAKDWWRWLRHSPFARFSLFFASLQFSVAISSPFFSVYLLRDLNYSYLQFMANSAVVVVMQFLTLAWWGRLGDAFGNRLILVATGAMIPVLPLLWLLSTDFFYLLSVQILAGLIWSGFSLSASNFLFDLVPPAKRVTLLAFHNVFCSACIFFGAMLGGWLCTELPTQITFAGETWQWISPIYGIFVLSAMLRGTVAVLFLPRLKEVREVRAMSVAGLIFRVARINALAGMMFDIIGSRRPRE
jgi:MFS family permease